MVKAKKNNIKTCKIDDNFGLFWQKYPRRVGKLAARREFEKALNEDSFENIMAGLDAFRKNLPDDPQFIPHPKTWLHQGRWQDEYEGHVRELTEAEKEYNNRFNHWLKNDGPHPGSREAFMKAWHEE